MNDRARVPEFADRLVEPESLGQRCIRTACSPAFAVAAVGYLVCAWLFVGASATTGDGSTGPDAGLDSPTAPRAVSGLRPQSPRVDEQGGAAPRIDPQFFSVLNQTLSDLGGDVSPNVRRGDDDLAAIPGPPVEVPAPDPSVPEGLALGPPPGPVPDPNGQVAAAAAPVAEAPVTSAVVPPTDPALDPNGQAASVATVVETPVVSNVPLPTEPLAEPNGSSSTAVTEPPLDRPTSVG